MTLKRARKELLKLMPNSIITISQTINPNCVANCDRIEYGILFYYPYRKGIATPDRINLKSDSLEILISDVSSLLLK